MNSKKNILDVLSGKKVDITPVFSATTCGITDAFEYANTSYPEAHIEPAPMARLGASLHEMIGLECVRVPFCLAVEAEALGCEVRLNEKSAGVIGTPYKTAEDIDLPDDFLERGRIPNVLKALQILVDEYPDTVVIAGAVGPLTLAGHLIGVENLLRQILTDILDVEATIDLACDALEEYIGAINEVGPDIICVADPDSSPDLLNPADYKRLSLPANEWIAAKMKPKSILHICGRTEPIIKDMLNSGFDGISIEEKCPMTVAQQIKKDNNSDVAIVGNISTSQTLFSSPASVAREECLQALKDGTDILAPSCGIAYRAPLANVKAMVDARNEYFNL